MAFVHLTPRLPVADLQRTIAFYRDVLGFTADLIWPDDAPKFAVLVRDEVEMAFFVLDEHRTGTIGYAEVYIEVTDAAALHAQLKDQVTIEWGPDVYLYGRREFAIRDPDSYLVIFSEPTDDLPTTEEPGA